MTAQNAEIVLKTGFSPCPNDTFMFHGLVAGEIRVDRLQVEPVLDDIAGLNRRVLGDHPDGRLPVSKVSVGVLAYVTDRYTVLRAGAALGRGCGPLVVRKADRDIGSLAELDGKRVAIPGERTTAYLLLRSFAPAGLEAVAMRFDRIMPAVAAGEVDAGLIIHESRFTYRDHGLEPIADLGDVWEQDTGLPIPLGVVVAERSLGEDVIAAFEAGMRASVELARREPERSRAYVRQHSQEMSEDVCQRHIDLYVNEFSVDLGDEGKKAIDELLRRGRAAGLLPEGASPWR